MRLGVISDTHGHSANTERAVRMLESLEIDRLLHCGDIGSAEVVAMLSAWPVDYVFGNCDYPRDELQAAIETAGKTCHGQFAELEIEGKRIALLHSDDRQRFQATVASGEWDLVCYGHTHVAASDLQGNTLVLNPGAIYRANPHSLAVVELPALEATIVEI